MPIIHIHSPNRSVEFSSHEEVIHTSPLEQAKKLHVHGSEWAILDPGFKGDITPECFGPEPGMPEASFGVTVDGTGDRATVAWVTGSSGGLLVAATAQDIGEASNSVVQRIPEDTPFVPFMRAGLGPLGNPRLQLGGLLLRATSDQINAFTGLFTRH